MRRKPGAQDTTESERTETLTVTEAARNFADVINRVRYLGERFFLTKGGEPVAEIRPLPIARVRTAGEFARWLKAQPSLGDDAEQFARDVEHARVKLEPLGEGPWE